MTPMPSYEINWRQHGVIVVYVGSVTMQDLMCSGSALKEDPRFVNCHYQLFDLLKADVSALSLDAVRDIALIDSNTSRQHPEPALAIVSREPLAEALVFHYRQLAETYNMTWPIALFQERDSAEAWCKRAADKARFE